MTAALDTDPDAWLEVNERKLGPYAQSVNTIWTKEFELSDSPWDGYSYDQLKHFALWF